MLNTKPPCWVHTKIQVLHTLHIPSETQSPPIQASLHGNNTFFPLLGEEEEKFGPVCKSLHDSQRQGTEFLSLKVHQSQSHKHLQSTHDLISLPLREVIAAQHGAHSCSGAPFSAEVLFSPHYDQICFRPSVTYQEGRMKQPPYPGAEIIPTQSPVPLLSQQAQYRTQAGKCCWYLPTIGRHCKKRSSPLVPDRKEMVLANTWVP